MKRLTTAFLLNKDEILPVVVNDPNLIYDSSKSHYLLIISRNHKFTKATIYPVDFQIVLKAIIKGSNMDHVTVSKIAKVLNKFEILHTSGIVAVNDGFLYEMYIVGEFGGKEEITQYYYQLKKIDGVDTLEEEWIKRQKSSNEE